MKCPKCSGAMEKISVDQYTVDRCTACEGIWFDLREHEHLKEIRGSERQIDEPHAGKDRQTDAIRDIVCPRCSAKLVKMTAPGQPHIHFEQCATCGGAFFDSGEFTDWKKLSVVERVKRLVAAFRR